MPKPVAAPTNKLFPMHYSGPRFCIPCMAGLRFPALVVKMCFSGPSWQSPLFCRIQPVQMHHPHLRRLVPSRQSACHRPLMHAAHLNPRIQMRSESDEAHHYLPCSPRTRIEAWTLECVLYKKYSGCCDMAKVLCIVCTGSDLHIHQTLYTSTSVGPTTFRVGYCLFCAHICPCCLIMSYNTV